MAAERGSRSRRGRGKRKCLMSSKDRKCEVSAPRFSFVPELPGSEGEMERRLEDILLRIAMETQEIKDLEQQLTEGQILANDALRKDLEGIISGLQQYYKSLTVQTSEAEQKVERLEVENESLRRRLEDTHRYCRRLEEQATAHKQAHSEDDKLSEMQPHTDRIRAKQRPRSRSRRDGESCLKDPTNCSNISAGPLDLHLLSSPEKEKEHRYHQHTETNDSEDDSGTLHCSAVGPSDGHRQSDRLRFEAEKLQRSLKKHRRVLGVCDEVWCVEQTLMKRRAELRRAQRLLQEAHSSTAQAQSEAEEWQRRAKDSIASLQQTQIQLREIQDEMQTLRKSRRVQNLDQSPILDFHSSDALASLRNQARESTAERRETTAAENTRAERARIQPQDHCAVSGAAAGGAVVSQEHFGLSHSRRTTETGASSV
ncbi:hypothetical protein WMY93_003989 [Mugilogobius chulae]|uniref:Uncharacterized protein n=1 Tax=Mugilogobius chulae TaxID=88201 RepID=A0AAW0PR26_9GOBI